MSTTVTHPAKKKLHIGADKIRTLEVNVDRGPLDAAPPRSVDAPPRSVDAPPRSVDAPPRSVDAPPRSVDAPPRSVE